MWVVSPLPPFVVWLLAARSPCWLRALVSVGCDV